MVKVSTRQVRSMRRDLHKTKQDAKRIRKKATVIATKLAIEEQTSNILRASLQNFSGPLYKLKRKYHKLYRAYAHKKNENDHLKRGIVQLNALRKRRKQGKTRCIDI